VALVALRHAAQLAREYRVTLISNSIPDELPGRVDGSLVRRADFSALRRFAHAPNEIAFARAVRRRLFELDVDFVLCEGDVPAALAAHRLKRERGVPFGIVTHGDMAGRPAGTFDRQLSALYRWAERRSARSADLVAALGPTMAQLARRRGAREESIAIIPNGVELRDIGLDPDTPPPARPERSRIAIVFAGRLAHEKGILVLVDAAHRLRERGVAFQLTIAGSGPLDEQARSRASGLDVTFLGAQPRTALGALYQDADVVVVPSLSEPFGLVIVEALAAGTPVIASMVDDVPAIVRDGENGLLVPAGDAALAAAIESLAVDRDRLRSLASRARASVLPRFSWNESGRLLRDAVRARLRHNR
jgi:glycogen(starch) synthase